MFLHLDRVGHHTEEVPAHIMTLLIDTQDKRFKSLEHHVNVMTFVFVLGFVCHLIMGILPL